MICVYAEEVGETSCAITNILFTTAERMPDRNGPWVTLTDGLPTLRFISERGHTPTNHSLVISANRNYEDRRRIVVGVREADYD